ncbi:MULTISPECIES: hypothetical protein [Flavobacteriaceae]|jgi:uncharacterized protein YfcZ (UPF0381/DUF406 family)|uniref:hypothetical protein n=1 Tax=Flavobacteriaceae TaxID=49546 RepID=UPI000C8B8D6C|nr:MULTISPECIES: hypothetical protein [Flavobacteriaceae]MAM22660.1 hypothetical protein [Croceibacter sp.]TVZ51253.1 hypothetical protein OD90_0389 [Dokdonia sp. Hel_I_53]WSP34676.1 hypothetical protein VVL01_01045 [Croceibacter atlanticus]
MSGDIKARLFMVSNPSKFERFEDHEAGIFIQLHELIEQARAVGENPIALIEEYLEVVYNEGNTTDEIASFLLKTDKMQTALWTLKESWDKMDDSLPTSSIMYGGMDKEEAVQLYSETTLRSYLEALAFFKNE